MLKKRDLMKVKLLTTALVLLGCIEAYAVSPPAPSYSLTDIGVLPGFTTTQGNSINALGQVAGSCYTYSPNGISSQHAFVYRRGKLIDFGALYNPGVRTIATFVNSEDEVTLTYMAPSSPYGSPQYSVLYRNGRFTKLPNGGSVIIGGLNDSGQIAGTFNYPGSITSTSSAFLLQPNGTVITLPAFGTYGQNVVFIGVNGITENGRVYGNVDGNSNESSYAVITSAYRPPIILEGSNNGDIQVNNKGDYVVVPAETSFFGPTELPVLHVRAKTINLPPVPGSENSQWLQYYTATGINDFDTVVGYELEQYTDVLRTFVYLDGTMYNLNTLVSPPAPLVHLFQVMGVNDAGQILATGGTNQDDTEHWHTFILNPVRQSQRLTLRAVAEKR
jgi:uncharacterized membrane protein